MRSELSWSWRPVAAVIAVVLAVAVAVGGLLQAPDATAAPGDDCATTTPTATATATATATESSEAPDGDGAGLAAAAEEGSDDECDPSGETSTPSSPTTAPTTGPTTAPTTAPVEDDVFEVSNARFRWGFNHQSNARSHNPGAYNFFSAGVANPGQGGVHLQPKHWRASAGDVTIQRWLGAGKGWGTAVWDGWKRTPTGAATGMDKNFSLHNVVIKRGTGTVDLGAAGTARIAWKGTFTVVYYSGNTLFTVTDPVLTVANGRGTVTAILGGWASDRGTMSSWEPVTPRRVTIAELPKVALNKTGFSVAPAYREVVARGFGDQVTDGVWGAFPQSMLDFLKPLGIAQFWYSTGLSTDHTKVPLPLTVSFTAKEVAAPTPDPEPSAAPEVTNPIVTPPAAPAPPAAVPSAPAAAPGLAEAPSAQPPRALLAADDLGAVTPAAAPVADASDSSAATWWLAGSLLLVAALLLLIPTPRPAVARRP